MDNDSASGMVCGPDGCEVDATTSATVGLPTAAAIGTRIDIVSDAICPWCYVGKRQLERALAILEKSAALDQRLVEAAAAVGLPFRVDLMTRTPNTIDAHRLIWFAGQHGDQDATMEAVFKAYFIEGRDIGEHAELADCAEQAGLPRQAVLDFLSSDLADAEMRAADQSAREAGVSGVPSFFLDGYSLFSGAMPAETIADALRRGHGILIKNKN
jgi:predicted DsbA family dithiol-disulfide isomerase